MENSQPQEEVQSEEQPAEANWPLRLLIAYAAVMASFLLGLMAWIFFEPEIGGWVYGTPFDSTAWKAQDYLEEDYGMWTPRLCMIEDLLEAKILDGLTEPEVLSLLGPVEEWETPPVAGEDVLHYFLGPERGFIGLDSEWLIIKLSEDRSVKRYGVYSY